MEDIMKMKAEEGMEKDLDERLSAIRKSMYDTALSAGIPIISGDECCQLLAWVYIYGGGHEQCVMDERLCNAILYAQQRLNINGGEVPDLELLPVLQGYIKSIEENVRTYKYHKDYDNPPEWVLVLEKKWDIKSHRSNK
jgi:hypothetical protein